MSSRRLLPLIVLYFLLLACLSALGIDIYKDYAYESCSIADDNQCVILCRIVQIQPLRNRKAYVTTDDLQVNYPLPLLSLAEDRYQCDPNHPKDPSKCIPRPIFNLSILPESNLENNDTSNLINTIAPAGLVAIEIKIVEKNPYQPLSTQLAILLDLSQGLVDSFSEEYRISKPFLVSTLPGVTFKPDTDYMIYTTNYVTAYNGNERIIEMVPKQQLLKYTTPSLPYVLPPLTAWMSWSSELPADASTSDSEDACLGINYQRFCVELNGSYSSSVTDHFLAQQCFPRLPSFLLGGVELYPNVTNDEVHHNGAFTPATIVLFVVCVLFVVFAAVAFCIVQQHCGEDSGGSEDGDTHPPQKNMGDATPYHGLLPSHNGTNNPCPSNARCPNNGNNSQSTMSPVAQYSSNNPEAVKLHASGSGVPSLDTNAAPVISPSSPSSLHPPDSCTLSQC